MIRQIQWALTLAYNRSFHDPARIFLCEKAKEMLTQEVKANSRGSFLNASLDGTHINLPSRKIGHLLNATTGRMVKIEADSTLTTQLFYQLDTDLPSERHLLMVLSEVCA
jgi:hypothetical protein